ncbi:hypothetical protein Avbf_03761 [Armadillidium vulgare]|nr:hypothetical protein Avbf_03761 [Armadillidium vulgare]
MGFSNLCSAKAFRWSPH